MVSMWCFPVNQLPSLARLWVSWSPLELRSDKSIALQNWRDIVSNLEAESEPESELLALNSRMCFRRGSSSL